MKFIDQLKDSLEVVWVQVTFAAPRVLGAILAIILALLIIKILVGILRKTLKIIRADKLDDKLSQIELFGDKKVKIKVIDISAKVVKWMLYILLIFIITDISELNIVSEGLKSLLSYLPKLLTALAIFILGLLFANFIKKSIQSFFESMDLSGSKFISQIIFILILVFVSITALNQADVDTEIITSNITLIIGAFLFAFALAFGLGAQKVIGDLLKAFYARKIYEIGKIVKFKNIEGEIKSIDGIMLTIKTERGNLVVPINDIVESQVEMQE